MRLSTVALIAALLPCAGARADSLEFVGVATLATEDIIGLSGIEVAPNGSEFLAIGDRGWFVRGNFVRDSAGAITDIQVGRIGPILGHTGQPVSARRVGDWADTEGLAIAPDGSIWISFERWAHVFRYETLDQPGAWTGTHPDFDDMRDNRQLEALAIAPDGAVYTFPELPRGNDFPVYRNEGESWVIDGHVPAADGFSIVGADFDDQGTLYILERKLVLGLWWQSRILRIADRAFAAPEILWTSESGDFYNLEGISVWHDGTGLRLTLVSDDNGSPREPTQFVEFRLTE